MLIPIFPSGLQGLCFHYFSTGVIGGLHWGLGMGLGVTASGVIISHMGIPKTYFLYSMVTVVVLVLFLFTHWLIKLRERIKENAGEASYNRLPTSLEDE